MNAVLRNSLSAVFSVVVLSASALDTLPESAPIVRTECGLVAGQTLTVSGQEVDAFYGVPYAEPPVGDLRFRKPVPARPWNGTFRATSKPPPCAQTNHFHTDNVTLYYGAYNSEDCLYLNVWRPTAPCKGTVSCQVNLPVVIFIHGGAFQWGDSAIFLHDGANFVALSNIIFVSFNYRLNVFGFLSAETEDVPGNWGLWDQNMLLKWVQRNIRFFGGDPNQVTLLGQSAGAISAAIHTVSPYSEGLFKRIIMLSGSPINVVFTVAAKGVDYVMSLARHVKCVSWKPRDLADVMDCLRTVDKQDFLRLLNGVDPRKTIYAPVSGDAYVPKDCTFLSTWRNKIRSTEVMIGTMKDEGSLFMDIAFRLAPFVRSYIDIDHRTTATAIISALFKIPGGSAKMVTEAYFPDEHPGDKESVLRTLQDAAGEGLFVCASNFFAEVAADQGLPVYRYVFAHRPSYSLWPRWYGATHGDDVPFVLGSLPFYGDPSRYTEAVLPDRALYDAVKHTDQEGRLMADMVAAIAAFVRTGRPTVPLSNGSWPRYTNANPEYVSVELDGPTKRLGPSREICNVWRRFLIRKDPEEEEVMEEKKEQEEEEEEEEEEEATEDSHSGNTIQQASPVTTPRTSLSSLSAALQPERTLNRGGNGVSESGCLQPLLVVVSTIAVSIVGRLTV
ncbi:acetylcholinesterase-1 isoform X1 [Dermacentor silvarum]|uniref:acetylcholinesterase-1 isoform X1 n=1 Tax=Dermacentor silvarum TaxID=543639 RepID=UPI002100B0DD|nr:acetylcholinesterase-1 isoform X1 [Dermacentor silvarum]